jgi:autotransporter-associated beta strand protein
MILGFQAGGSGSYTLGGSGLLSAALQYIGYHGSGTFTQSGGTNLQADPSGGMLLARDPGTLGTYNLNGGLFVLAGGMYSGSGNANFNFSGGTLQAAATQVAVVVPTTLPTGGSNGTVDANGNTIFLAAPVSGPGGLNLIDSLGGGVLVLYTSNNYSGGTSISSGGSVQLGDPAGLGTGGLTINAGTLDLSGYSAQVASLSGGSTGTVTNGAGGLASLTVSQSDTTTFYGSIQDGIGQTALIKSGTGKLILVGTDTYTGGTSVIAGTLRILNSAAIASGTDLNVGDGTAVFPAAIVPSAVGHSSLSHISLTNAHLLAPNGNMILAVDDGMTSGDVPSGSMAMTTVPEPGALLLMLAAAGLVSLRQGYRGCVCRHSCRGKRR